jgi:hypothetical protein
MDGIRLLVSMQEAYRDLVIREACNQLKALGVYQEARSKAELIISYQFYFVMRASDTCYINFCHSFANFAEYQNQSVYHRLLKQL